MQALIGAMVMGYVTTRVRILHPIAHGFIKVGNAILRLFKGVIWYYPVMIFFLAIGIPLKFGSNDGIVGAFIRTGSLRISDWMKYRRWLHEPNGPGGVNGAAENA